MTTTKRQTVVWTGKSGTKYTYRVYSLDTNWDDVPGNYIFAKRDSTRWTPIYIGETSSLKDRLPNHEKWPCAKRNGVTDIHAHVNSNGRLARVKEEADLKEAFKELC